MATACAKPLSVAALSLMALACVPAGDSAPPVTTTPAPTPAPVQPPALSEPVYENWLDAPQTQGDWFYQPGGGQSVSRFGTAGGTSAFVMRCDMQARSIMLERPGRATTAVPMRIRTETQERLLSLRPTSNGVLSATLSATDPLLDAIAFSRGRFAVETGGLPTLYLPAWPEITRVIQDCR